MAYFDSPMKQCAVSSTRSVASRVAMVVLGLAASAACASRAPEVGLPPIPMRSGSLVIDVVYPPDSNLVAARDSNFIFGSIGNGSARLTINGYDVSIQPNGAFLAWLPVPGAPGDSLADYHLTASLGDQRASSIHTIRRPPAAMPLTSESAMIDTASMAPRGSWWVRDGEAIPIIVRASPGAAVRLLLPSGDTLALTPEAADVSGAPAIWVFGRVPTSMRRSSSSVFRGELIAREPVGRGYLTPTLSPMAGGASSGELYCSLAVDAAVVDADSSVTVLDESAEFPEGCAIVEVATRDDTTRVPFPLDVWIQSDQPVIELREQPSAIGSDGFVVGRAARGATTLWMWIPEMRARVTGRRDGAVRLGLDGQTEAWVALDETVWMHGLTLPARARVETVRFEGRSDGLRTQVVLPYPVPYQVEIEGKRLTLILYGAYSNTNWLRYGASDPFLRSAAWEQASSDRYLLHIELAERPWGYRVRYDSGSLILDIRKPPAVDDKKPLAGRKIAVDPGHPPAGATGPTRLYEADANLAIAEHLRRLLEEDGATVVMTRTDSSSVRLYDRTRHAEMMDAEILVSIHNNALPDGVNPFENNGTSVFYFHPGSLDLARALQRNLLKTMGLRDLGIGRASLALARPTWMPAVLTEGAFMMIPEQEAALRDPAFQEAYARGVLEGLREFLRERSE